MVKNPRWQNFKSLFHFIDRGHPSIDLDHGYNGGLFNDEDDKSIAQLELPDDPWTNAFARFSIYDFKHEVSVDILGHIFERSITELEKRRAVGLFEKTDPAVPPPAQPKMQKSAERKRFGIFYTPPEFTHFLVDQTVGELLRQRFADLAKSHGVTPEELAAEGQTAAPKLLAYYQQCLLILRAFKILDPACGSGAFLIAAYELLEDLYHDIIRHLRALGDKNADRLRDQIPDFILKDNLYGVDLSEEAVEITRLALWIRSAQPGKTLADLSHNIVVGNSLVDDKQVHPLALNWQTTFPDVFSRPEKGFDAVVGNPPWERLKLQEREFFAFSAPEIASAVSAATRRKLIEKLGKQNPELHARYLAKQSDAEKTSEYARFCGRFPLTAQGDINTYMLFAELARTLVSPAGRVGILVPSGIATDHTTREFFADLIESESLIKLYDFENKLGIFPDVDGRFKFCTLVFGGSAVKTHKADFVFFAHSMDDLEVKRRHIPLSKRDIANLNPNSLTCPIFRSRRDFELTSEIYAKVRILIDYKYKDTGNPWAIRFVRLFDQTNDAELFTEPKDLAAKGFVLEGNHFVKGKSRFLPLYEAKMIQAFDHRAASVKVDAENWVRQGQTIETRSAEHQSPGYMIMPRWWVEESHVKARLDNETREGFLCMKDVTSPTNQRTMIASFIPWAGVVNSAPLLLTTNGITSRQGCCLLANLNSFAYDFVARQKVGGLHLNFFIVEQLPTLPPDAYADKCPWDKKRGGQTLESWISERVLKLSCTANDMIPLAQACNFNPDGRPPFVWKWKDQERADLRAQLDAAYFHLYAISRNDAAYLLSTFQATGDASDPHSTTSLILDHYDRLAP